MAKSVFDRDGPLVVHAGIYEIYHFDKADKKGWRDVYLENDELEFDRCRIAQLVKGNVLLLYHESYDGLEKPYLSSDPVIYIRQEKPN